MSIPEDFNSVTVSGLSSPGVVRVVSFADEEAARAVASRVRLLRPVLGAVTLGLSVRNGLVWFDVRMRVPEDASGRNRLAEGDTLEVQLVDHLLVADVLDSLRGGGEACAMLLLAEKAREVLHRALAHEADEMLVVGGERVFDPHRPAPPPALYRVVQRASRRDDP